MRSFVLKLVFTLAVVYWVISVAPLQDYQRAWSLLTFKPLLLVLLLGLTQVGVLSLRWHLFAKANGCHLQMKNSLYGILISFFFSQGLPASIGGDAFRIWWHRRVGDPIATALKIIFFDRLYGLLSLVVLCVISLISLAHLLNDDPKITTLFLIVILTGLGLGMLVMPWKFGVSSLLQHLSLRISSRISPMLQWLIATRGTLRNQTLRFSFLLLGLGVIVHLLVVMEVYVIGHAISPDKISWIKCLGAVPPALLVSYMPFSIAGWGVREASMVVAFGMLGVTASTAVIISIIVGLTIFLIAMAGGLIWIAGGYKARYHANVSSQMLGDSRVS